MNPQAFVLDAWPIVEWLLGKQPAARKFPQFLDEHESPGTRLLITRINRGEILYTMPRRLALGDQIRAQNTLDRLQLDVVSIDDQLVDRATELKRIYSCSYADCFASALAIREGTPLVTGDSELLKLQSDHLLKLHWLGA